MRRNTSNLKDETFYHRAIAMNDEQVAKVLSLVWKELLTKPDRVLVEFLSAKVYADHGNTPSENQIEAFLKKACIQRQTEPEPKNTVDFDTMLDQSGVHSLRKGASNEEIIKASKIFAKYAMDLDQISIGFAKSDLVNKLKSLSVHNAKKVVEDIFNCAHREHEIFLRKQKNQKTASLDVFHPLNVFHQWWLDCLREERLLGADPGGWPTGNILKERVRDAFRRYCEQKRLKAWIPNATSFGRSLLKCVPPLVQTRIRTEGDLGYAYRFPSVRECRLHWEQFIGHECEWENEGK